MTTATKSPAQYLECFTEFESRAVGSDLPWLRRLRREAFARFCEAGFPTTHDEDWRFTSVAAIANMAFHLPSPSATFAKGGQMSATLATSLRMDGAACCLVFLNGHFSPELSDCAPLARELAAGSALCGLIEQHLGHYADMRRDSFSALNTAFAEDGALVHVPRGVVVERPIYLLFVSTLESPPVMSHPRNLILADENSQVSVVEDYVWLGGGSGFCTARGRTERGREPGARLPGCDPG